MDDGKTLEKLRGNRTVSLCLLKTARPQTTWMESIWFAALRFLLTSAVLNVADSALSFVDPARPRHCSFSLISRGPHLAKTPNEAICPDPRSAAVFAQPQCALACSAEHHMWQDVVMMAAKHSSAISEHYLCRSPVIWMCAGHRWHRGAEGWRQFVLFPFPHLALFFFFFFYAGKRGRQPPPLNSRSNRRPGDHSGPKWQLSSQLSRPIPLLSWGVSVEPNR